MNSKRGPKQIKKLKKPIKLGNEEDLFAKPYLEWLKKIKAENPDDNCPF